MSKPSNRRCTKCLVIKRIDDFYRKRNQWDTICKECKCAARRAKYVSREKVNEMETLIKFFDIMFDIEMKALKNLEKKCDRIINKYKKEEDMT